MHSSEPTSNPSPKGSIATELFNYAPSQCTGTDDLKLLWNIGVPKRKVCTEYFLRNTHL